MNCEEKKEYCNTMIITNIYQKIIRFYLKQDKVSKLVSIFTRLKP